MKTIEPDEILGLAEYEIVRERFRTRVMGEKSRRRVSVGPNVSALFENRDTVLLQIQEMLRTERITRSADVKHELDTYNELVPGEDEISCTLMIDIADKSEREAFLRAVKGLERHVWLVLGDERMAARSSERYSEGPVDRTTAVHYLKFSLPKNIADSLRAAQRGRPTAMSIALEIDHPAYFAHTNVPAETVVAIGEDLKE